MSIETLRAEYPWPKLPSVTPNYHGWFSGAEYFPQFTGPQIQVYLELGTWLGKSALWFAERCPNATIICVDHWKGSPARDDINGHDTEPGCKALLPTLWETFVVNVQHEQERIIPVKADTMAGMRDIYKHGVKPDIVYVDACHSEQDVCRDVHGALQFFPNAQIIGDDWGIPQVQRGIMRALRKHKNRLVFSGNVWSLKARKSNAPDSE